MGDSDAIRRVDGVAPVDFRERVREADHQAGRQNRDKDPDESPNGSPVDIVDLHVENLDVEPAVSDADTEANSPLLGHIDIGA